MTDVAAPDTGTDAPTDTQPDATDTDTTDWKAEAEKFKSLARKHEDRAKANAQAQKELDDLRKASMTDLEKAIADATTKARTDTLTEVGGKLAIAEIRAAAAGRLGDQQFTALLEGVDPTRFLNVDGDVDTDRVKQFVEGIAPQPTENTDPFAGLDLGQGAGHGGDKNLALNGDPLLAAVKARLSS
jgi:hypothetical protein